MNDAWNVQRALDESGLTLTEVADRAGFNPADVERVVFDRLPSSVVARLADVLGLSKLQLLDFRAEQKPERPSDPSVVGAYIGEFAEGVARDELDLAGRLDLTAGRARMSIERGQASPNLEQHVAKLVFRAITRVARVRDDEQEHADIARRRGLVDHRQGCTRTTAPVDYSLRLNDRWLQRSEPSWNEDRWIVRPC